MASEIEIWCECPKHQGSDQSLADGEDRLCTPCREHCPEVHTRLALVWPDDRELWDGPAQ